MNYSSTKNQRILGKLVERELIANISYLMSELISADLVNGYDFIKYDYEEVAREYLLNNDFDKIKEEWSASTAETIEEFLEEEAEDLEEFCYTYDIEERVYEPYEYYIVTDWFGEKLKAQGEIVQDVFNLTVWGRCTTGQAVLLDYVVGKIGEDMGILEGQEREWFKDL